MAAAVGVVGVVFISFEAYRMDRIKIWLNPEATRRVIRPYRDCMRSVPAVYLEKGLARVCRSWDLFLRRRMI